MILSRPKSKKENEEINKVKLSEIKKNIPNDYQTEPDNIKQFHMIEWRWRILEVKGKIVLELSHKYPNLPRTFMNTKGKWIHYNLEPEYDKKVLERYYVYRYSND
jgi:hypothetical protein